MTNPLPSAVAFGWLAITVPTAGPCRPATSTVAVVPAFAGVPLTWTSATPEPSRSCTAASTTTAPITSPTRSRPARPRQRGRERTAAGGSRPQSRRCDLLWPAHARQRPRVRAIVTELTCALGPDSAGTLIHRFIDSAASRLDVAVYEAGPSYGWMFPRAAERGVRVRLLLDGHGGANRGCIEELRSAAARGVSVPCRVHKRERLREAHWKVLVADSDRLGVGTGNLIERDAPADRHHQLPPAAPPLAGTREWWAFVAGAPTLAALARARVT